MLFENDPETKPTYHDYQAMLQLAESSQSGRRYLIGPAECIREHDQLIFRLAVNPASSDFDLPVQTGENYQWDDPPIRFSSQILNDYPPDSLELGKHAGIEYIDGQKIYGQLALRTWKAGDTFFPIGMNTSKKLSDFFTDQKIALSSRNRIPILIDRSADQERIIWICGYRLDNRYKIDPNTKRIIKLECHGHEIIPKN